MVRDALARLDREREGLRHLRRPLLEHALLRQPVERVVDLDGGKPARVVAKPAVLLEVGGIERALPLLERVPARAGEQLHDTLTAAPPSPPVLARLALSASMRSMIFPLESGCTSAVMSWPSIFR